MTSPISNNHPITPPNHLLSHWQEEINYGCSPELTNEKLIEVARWGADQEFEACDKSLREIWQMDHVSTLDDFLRELHAARRPKPPSLKERIATAIAHGDNSIALALLDQALPD